MDNLLPGSHYYSNNLLLKWSIVYSDPVVGIGTPADELIDGDILAYQTSFQDEDSAGLVKETQSN